MDVWDGIAVLSMVIFVMVLVFIVLGYFDKGPFA
jgi:hypothetical protein